MIIAHYHIILVTNAMPAEDCLIYNAFLSTYIENLHREYFFLTTMNVHGGNVTVTVFALRQDDSYTIYDSLVHTEK